MWSYILRRVLYNIPVYLGILLLVMVLLRVNDPVYAYLGKNATPAQYQAHKKEMGLDRPFLVQYADFVWNTVRLDFSERSWEQRRPVGPMIRDAIPPTLAITVPALVVTAIISICIGIVSSYYRGRFIDRALVFLAVLGMSVSYLVYIIMGQYFGTFWLSAKFGASPFAIAGYEPFIGVDRESGFFFRPQLWVTYCALPVLINVIVAMGYDTRFYRTVMVEESGRDYITTAVAKGATKRKVMFVHMLKNAMIPIITRIMITIPFLITGSVLVEVFFNIPGMGRTLIGAILSKDFPVVQAFTAVFAAFLIFTIILTDVLYALVDPRVRLS